MVADEPLDAEGHGHVVLRQGTVAPGGERNGDAIAAEVDGGLATGNGRVVGQPADEPRRGAEVGEVEGLLEAIVVALPGRQGAGAIYLAGVAMVASFAVPPGQSLWSSCHTKQPGSLQ
jgi:hypothetical protein